MLGTIIKKITIINKKNNVVLCYRSNKKKIIYVNLLIYHKLQEI